MSWSKRAVSTWAVCLVSLTVTASAQRGTPGSLLLFPEFDARIGAGMLNLITVTNSDVDPSGSSLETHWNYVNGYNCSRVSVIEPFNVADTLTVVANAHCPTPARGYLYVYAIDPVTDQAIVHNHLIGTSTILDGFGALEYTVEPLSLEGIGDGQFTDLNLDGIQDFDGLEYGMVADQIAVPRFLGQTSDLSSHLVLVDLTGGPGMTAELHFLIYNDNEEVFSASWAFDCWARVPLLTISAAFDNSFLAGYTNHDPNEVLGAPSIESGWLRVDGHEVSDGGGWVIEDPAFACILVDGKAATYSTTCIYPAGLGKQDNGGVFPDGSRASSGQSR